MDTNTEHTTDRHDDGAGSGWSVVALVADGTAVDMGAFGTFGAAADVAADAARLARSADVLGADGRTHGWHVVVVPSYAAADMLAGA
jgi:hypothetical protein